MFRILFIFAAATCWAVDTLFRYPLLGQGLAPVYIVWLEHLFLLLLLSPWIGRGFIEHLKIYRRQDWLGFFVIGFLGSGLATLAFTRAFSLLSPTIVILLQKLQPFVAHLFATLLLKEKISQNFWWYFIVAMTGSMLLSFPQLDFSVLAQFSMTQNQQLMGLILTLVSVLFWGMATVFGKQLSLSHHKPMNIMYGRFLFGFIYLSLHLGVVHNQVQMKMQTDQLLSVFYLVVLSGLMGMYFYYQGMKHLTARQVAVGELFFPVAATVINWFAFSIRIEPLQIFGAVLLIAASFLFVRNE